MPSPRALLGTAVLAALAVASAQDPARGEELRGLETILDEIGALEAGSDPKCNASASRLEDFIYGTPLSFAARDAKVELQKDLVLRAWRHAAAQATGDGPVDLAAMDRAAMELLGVRRLENGAVEVTLGDLARVTLDPLDLRHYASVAFALRAVLAVEQENLLAAQPPLPPLAPEAVERLAELVNLHTLAALHLADLAARAANEAALTAAGVRAAWRRVGSPLEPVTGAGAAAGAPGIVEARRAPGARFPVLGRIVEQKLASYEAYNAVSLRLFWQNLRSYIARHPWPDADEELGRLQSAFARAVTMFVTDVAERAAGLSRAAGEPLIRAAAVETVQHEPAPFHVNHYEDVVFFPRLGPAERVTIESYDMDAFRDSGLHWKYLGRAFEAGDLAVALEPDPFAAELLAEAAAQYGVLVFRVAGTLAREAGAPAMTAEHIIAAQRRVQALAAADRARPEPAPQSTALASAPEPATPAERGGARFENATAALGVYFVHRSSDWLSRFQRSYLYSLDERGASDVPAAMDSPPSFSGGGIAAEDVNGDGRIDLLLVGGLGNALFVQQGDGTFADRTAAAALDHRRLDGHPGEPRQPLFADLDNDGDQDLVITYVRDDHRVYRNRGDGTFDDVTATAGLGGRGLVGGPATVFDHDRDGLLDLYIGYFGNYVEGARPRLVRHNDNADPNRLFRNRGDLRFEDVTERSGTGDRGWAQAVAHVDIDADGWQDLVVANDFGRNAFLRNRGDGTFEDVTARLEADVPAHSMNVGVADLNGDELPDVYVSNIVTLLKDEKYVLPTADTPMRFDPDSIATLRVVEANHLFVSQADGSGRLARYALSDAVKRGLTSTGWAWDADFADLDNDGDDDLYVTNGHIDYPIYDAQSYRAGDRVEGRLESNFAERESNVLFVNRDGGLYNDSSGSGADLLGNSRAAAYADLDADGDLEVVINNFHSPATVLRNTSATDGKGWIGVRLVGDPRRGSSRDAIGAVLVGRTPRGRTTWRTVQGSTGYLSAHPKLQHFGLGSESGIDLTVRWPDGSVERFEGLAAGRVWELKQGQPTGRAG